jgi:hypothetical protein
VSDEYEDGKEVTGGRVLFIIYVEGSNGLNGEKIYRVSDPGIKKIQFFGPSCKITRYAQKRLHRHRL